MPAIGAARHYREHGAKVTFKWRVLVMEWSSIFCAGRDPGAPHWAPHWNFGSAVSLFIHMRLQRAEIMNLINV